MNEYLMLDLDANHCTAEAWINDLPVARVSALSPQIQLPVHEFLAPGRNYLRVVIESGPTPTAVPLPDRAPMVASPGLFARLRLMQMPEGSFPEDPGVVTLLNMDYRPPAGTAFPTPLVLESEGEGPIWIPPASWHGASQISDSPALRDFVWRFLTQLADSMNRRDIEPYLASSRVRFQEISAAYQLGAEQEIENFRKQFARLSAEPGFAMEPIVLEDMALRICGAGRVIDCLDKNWQPLLRSVPRVDGVTRYRLPAKLAFFGGEVHIIR